MLSKKSIFIRALQIVFAVSIVAYLLSLVDWQSVRALVNNGLLYQLWAGPLILIFGLALAAERWRLILFCFDQLLSRVEAVSIYLIGTFYGVLLPGVLGGDVVRIALCRQKTGGSTASIVGTVGIERGLGLWGVALIGSLGAVSVSIFMPDAVSLPALLILPFLAVSVPVAFFVGLYFLDKVERIKISSLFVQRVVKFIRDIRARFATLPLSLIFSTLILSTAFQTSEILIYYYFGTVLGIDIPFIFYLFLVPIVYLSTVLPISIGGIGVREGVLVIFLAGVGVAASDAVVLAFLVYLNRIVIALVGGLVQVVGLAGKK